MQVVRELGCPVLLGNHDEAACLPEPPEELNDTATAGIVFASARLCEPDRERIKSLPRNLAIEGAIFTHSSLARSFGWPYITSPDNARCHFLNQPSHLAFCGHTHKPMVWWQESPGGQVTQRTGKDITPLPPGGKVLVNAGAVGQPRDGELKRLHDERKPPSAKQRRFIDGLLKETATAEEDAAALVGVASLQDLTGGREGTASALIDALDSRKKAKMPPKAIGAA